MQVCIIASARDAIVGPGLISRMAWSPALFHWITALGVPPPGGVGVGFGGGAAKVDPRWSLHSVPAPVTTISNPAPVCSIVRLLNCLLNCDMVPSCPLKGRL